MVALKPCRFWHPLAFLIAFCHFSDFLASHEMSRVLCDPDICWRVALFLSLRPVVGLMDVGNL
jgi:hypothetical protein